MYPCISLCVTQLLDSTLRSVGLGDTPMGLNPRYGDPNGLVVHIRIDDYSARGL